MPLPTPVLDLNASVSGSYSGSGSTWYDLTANNYDFTLYSPSFTSATSSTPGYFTFPLRAQTSALNVYAEYIGTPAVTDSTFSFICWVNRNPSADSYAQYFETVFYNGGGNAPYNGCGIQCKGINQGGGNYGLFQVESQTLATYNSSVEATDGSWDCVGISVNGSTLSFYVNGVYAGGSPSFNQVTPTTGMYISKSDNKYSFMGDISIVRVYDSTLTSTEFNDVYLDDLANYIAPTPPPPAGVVGGRTFGQGFAG